MQLISSHTLLRLLIHVGGKVNPFSWKEPLIIFSNISSWKCRLPVTPHCLPQPGTVISITRSNRARHVHQILKPQHNHYTGLSCKYCGDNRSCYNDTSLHKETIQLYLRMMTSSNGNIFRVTGPLVRRIHRHRWLPLTKGSDAELWCFLWSAPE